MRGKLKGWRTIAFNVLSTIFPIMSLTEWGAVLPDMWEPYWMLFVALGNTYLRTITTTPVGRSKRE